MQLMAKARLAVAGILTSWTALACATDSPVNPPGQPPQPPTPLWTAESCPDGVNGDTLRVFTDVYARDFALGDTLTIGTFVYNGGQTATCNVVFSSSDSTHIRVLSGSRIVAVGVGPATITGRVPNASTWFNLGVVAQTPAFVPRRYSLIDLGDAYTAVRMNAHRQVLLSGKSGYMLWDNDAIITIDGCPRAYDLNANGAVLCRSDNNISLWQKGVGTPVNALLVGAAISLLFVFLVYYTPSKDVHIWFITYPKPSWRSGEAKPTEPPAPGWP